MRKRRSARVQIRGAPGVEGARGRVGFDDGRRGHRIARGRPGRIRLDRADRHLKRRGVRYGVRRVIAISRGGLGSRPVPGIERQPDANERTETDDRGDEDATEAGAGLSLLVDLVHRSAPSLRPLRDP